MSLTTEQIETTLKLLRKDRPLLCDPECEGRCRVCPAMWADELFACADAALSRLREAQETPAPVETQGHELPRCGGCGGRCVEPLRDGLCAECWRRYPRLRQPRSGA